MIKIKNEIVSGWSMAIKGMRNPIGTVSNSCSTMHKIHSKEFTIDDFSHDHLNNENWKHELELIVSWLNDARQAYLDTESKDHWWHMIQLLPSSYN